MTKKLFYNGDILTLEDELYAEAVLVEDGKIKAVGKKDELMIQNSDACLLYTSWIKCKKWSRNKLF